MAGGGRCGPAGALDSEAPRPDNGHLEAAVQNAFPGAVVGAVRALVGDLRARVLRGALPASGDPRAARESLSDRDRGRADRHTQEFPEEFLRRSGRAGEVDVDRPCRHDRAGARQRFATRAHPARGRPVGHARDLPSRQLGVAVAGRDPAARISGGGRLQAPARCLGRTARARGALALRRALDPRQGTARRLSAPPRRRARARHERRPGTGVHGQTLLDALSGPGHRLLRGGRADRARHAPAGPIPVDAAREPRAIRSRDSRALGRA